MSSHDEMDTFATPAAELEARIEEARARGDAVPPEAFAMLARLRELMAAIEGLNATVGEGRAPDVAPPAPADARAGDHHPADDDTGDTRA